MTDLHVHLEDKAACFFCGASWRVPRERKAIRAYHIFDVHPFPIPHPRTGKDTRPELLQMMEALEIPPGYALNLVDPNPVFRVTKGKRGELNCSYDRRPLLLVECLREKWTQWIRDARLTGERTGDRELQILCERLLERAKTAPLSEVRSWLCLSPGAVMIEAWLEQKEAVRQAVQSEIRKYKENRNG